MTDRSVFPRTRPSLRRTRQTDEAVQAVVEAVNIRLAGLRERELVRAAEEVEAVR